MYNRPFNSNAQVAVKKCRVCPELNAIQNRGRHPLVAIDPQSPLDGFDYTIFTFKKKALRMVFLGQEKQRYQSLVAAAN